MIVNESAENRLRLEGRVFSGFANPATGKIHRLRVLTGDERTNVLFQLAMEYTSHFGLWSTGSIKFPEPGAQMPSIDEVALQPNPPHELHIKIETAAKYLPDSESRVDYGVQLSRFSKGNQPIPRVILLSDGDQKNVPPEFYDKFCYWFLPTVSPKEVAARFETRFDAIFNLAAHEARRIAEAGGGKNSRQVYEEILDQAIADAEVTLEPLLSHAPTKVHALALKTFAYVLLAREGLVPDGFFGAANAYVDIAPLDYFADRNRWAWRTDRDGFYQLLSEVLLIGAENMWRKRQKSDFQSVQTLLDVIQFLEDIVIFLPRSGAVFDRLLPE